MNYMRATTHEMNPDIPAGMATLELDNNGFVGTSNGHPMFGRPALFPESQARAILSVWTYVQKFHPQLDEHPQPEEISPDVFRWLNGSGHINIIGEEISCES